GGNEIVRTARGPARGLTQRNWNVSPGERCIEGRVICRLDYSLILFRRLNQKASEIQVRPATQRRGGLGPQIITCGREFQFPVWSSGVSPWAKIVSHADRQCKQGTLIAASHFLDQGLEFLLE